MRVLYFLLSLIVFASCATEEEVAPDLFVGTWQLSEEWNGEIKIEPSGCDYTDSYFIVYEDGSATIYKFGFDADKNCVLLNEKPFRWTKLNASVYRFYEDMSDESSDYILNFLSLDRIEIERDFIAVDSGKDIIIKETYVRID